MKARTTRIYDAFGHRLFSDILLPELRSAVDSESLQDGPLSTDLTITEGSHLEWPALAISPHSTQSLAMAPGDWRLELEGVGWFRVCDGQYLNWERWDDSVSDRDLRTFLVTSGLGALLIQRGALVLNATTLVRDGKAVMLLGAAVSGKSSLAWCLLQQGWQLLSSELSVVDPRGMVWPGIQQLKLWHDSAVALGLNWQQLPLVRRGLKRYAVLPPQLPVADQPAPLAVIYDMASRDKEKHQMAAGETEWEPAARNVRAFRLESERATLLRIRNQAYQPRFYRAMGQEGNLFLKASSLAQQGGRYLLKMPEGVALMRQAMESVDFLDPETLVQDPVQKSDEVAR